MPGYKRSVEWVDLTSSSPPPQVKHARVEQPPITPPVSSQPPLRSSFNPRDYFGGDSEGTELIDLSQDVEEGFGWVNVGFIHGKIVGIRYYDGYATPGEQVMVRREPLNPIRFKCNTNRQCTGRTDWPYSSRGGLETCPLPRASILCHHI